MSCMLPRFGSPIRQQKSTIFTADAFGDYLSGTVQKYDKKNNRLIKLNLILIKISNLQNLSLCNNLS